MFLESYKAAWILTEDHSFEDRMIDDLSVSWGRLGDVGARLGKTKGALHIETRPLRLDLGKETKFYSSKTMRGD